MRDLIKILNPKYPESALTAELAQRITAIFDEHETRLLMALATVASTEDLAFDLADMIRDEYNLPELRLAIVNELLLEFEPTRAEYLAAIKSMLEG